MTMTLTSSLIISTMELPDFFKEMRMVVWCQVMEQVTVMVMVLLKIKEMKWIWGQRSSNWSMLISIHLQMLSCLTSRTQRRLTTS